MSTPRWILLISGLIVLYVGVGLMAYGALQKRARAGRESGIAQILKAIAGLVHAFGKYLGASLASKVGFILILLGLFLIFAPFYIPSMGP
jgi:predicted transporter